MGSNRHVLDGSGVLKTTIAYDGFGNITSETDIAYRSRYAWTGRELDTETSLQYNRARYYDGKMGRWTSQDPLGFDAGDGNLYRYVVNRPAAYLDASGLDSLSVGTVDGLHIAPHFGFRVYVDTNRVNPNKLLITEKRIEGSFHTISYLFDGSVDIPVLKGLGVGAQATLAANGQYFLKVQTPNVVERHGDVVFPAVPDLVIGGIFTLKKGVPEVVRQNHPYVQATTDFTVYRATGGDVKVTVNQLAGGKIVDFGINNQFKQVNNGTVRMKLAWDPDCGPTFFVSVVYAGIEKGPGWTRPPFDYNTRKWGNQATGSGTIGRWLYLGNVPLWWKKLLSWDYIWQR